MVVDHPSGTEVFVDERFARRPPPLAVHATGPLHPVAYARDDRGRDVTEVGRRPRRPLPRHLRPGLLPGRDARPLGRGRARRRRAARPAAPAGRPRLDPSDRQLDQRRHRPGPPGPSRRAWSWKSRRPAGAGRSHAPDLGFPGGQEQDDPRRSRRRLPPGGPRRFRLRTNLEVFWDSLAVAVAAPETPLKTQRLAPRSAELRPRGYSLMTQADASSPELPRLRHAHRHGPALARPDRLLHAVRRRPRAA